MLSDELVKLPEEISGQEKKLLAISIQLVAKKREIDLWELNQARNIAEANEDGKKLYSNEAIRTAELESRKLSKGQLYQELADLDYLKKTEEIELNYLNNKFKMFRTLIGGRE